MKQLFIRKTISIIGIISIFLLGSCLSLTENSDNHDNSSLEIEKAKFNRSALHIASMSGDYEKVKENIENGADLDCFDDFNYTPLELAVFFNHYDVAKLLIESGAEINEIEDAPRNNRASYCTALHWASKFGYKDLSELLIENGADINNTGKNMVLSRFTPLHLASEEGHLDVVKLLVQNGADINIKNRKEKYPLHYAARNGHTEIAKYLIGNGTRILISAEKKNNILPLDLASANGHYETSKLLFKKMGNYIVVNDPEKMKKLNEALDGIENLSDREVWARLSKFVDILIQQKEMPGFMKAAVENGHYKLVDYFIQNGVSINDHWLIAEAVSNKHYRVAELLVKNGAPNADPKDSDKKRIYVPLVCAVDSGNISEVQKLINAGEDLEEVQDIPARGFYTPLTKACYSGNYEMVKLLVESGTDVNNDNSGKSPLELAIGGIDQGMKYEIIQLLLERGAKANFEIDKKIPFDLAQLLGIAEYPLHFAAANNDKDTLVKLSKTESNINRIDDFDYTPLHVAAETGNLSIVKYLVQNGARLELEAVLGRTPLLCAARKGHYEICKFLIDAGAETKPVLSKLPNKILNNETLSLKLCKLLIENGSEFDKGIIGDAVLYGSPELVEILIDKEPTLLPYIFYEIQFGPSGYSTEYVEIEKVYQSIVLLREKGADISIVYDTVDNPVAYDFGWNREVKTALGPGI